MDFGKFYDDCDSYRAIRDTSSVEYKKMIDEIDLWKNKYLSELIKFENNINTILEVGCATGELVGRFPIDLSKENRFGIDISKKNIEAAKKRYPEINFFCGTIEDMIKDSIRKFDLVILSDILEHVPDDVKLLKNASKLSDRILINLPLEKCLANVKRKYGENDPSGHLRWYGKKDAFRLIEKAELKIERYCIKQSHRETFMRKYHKQRLITNEDSFVKLLTNGIPKYLIMLFPLTTILKITGANLFALLKK